MNTGETLDFALENDWVFMHEKTRQNPTQPLTRRESIGYYLLERERHHLIKSWSASGGSTLFGQDIGANHK